MSAAFTPGPWWVDDRRANGSLQVQAKHRGEGSSYCVATVNYWEVPEANANLIASAPDLYDALAAMVADHRAIQSKPWPAFENAVAALARARGEPA